MKFKDCLILKKISSLSILGLLILASSLLSGQIKPISVVYVKDSIKFNSLNVHPILLSNDSNGIFYLDNISNNTIKLKSQSDSTSQNYIINLKDFNLNDGLLHCIVKNKDSIILLNRLNNSLHFFECKWKGNTTECKKYNEYNVELEKSEKIIRIAKDNQNIYLVSYNFKSRSQNFYLLKPKKNSIKLLFSNFNPFLEIFFSDENISNYSFFNNKLSLSDFYSGTTLIVDLLNSHVDSVKLPIILNEKRPSHGTFVRLNNMYDKFPTMTNYDSLLNLVYNYNHIVNSFFLNDTTILICIRYTNQNFAHFDIIGVDLSTQNAFLKQKRINTKSISENVNLTNMPIYIGNEETNYIGDGIIYVYKEMPELNKYDLREFLNRMNQQVSPKIGTFIMYKYLPELK